MHKTIAPYDIYIRKYRHRGNYGNDMYIVTRTVRHWQYGIYVDDAYNNSWYCATVVGKIIGAFVKCLTTGSAHFLLHVRCDVEIYESYTESVTGLCTSERGARGSGVAQF